MGNGCMLESKLACTHAGGGTAKHERRDAISAYPTPFWICLFLFGLIAAMAKRKNKMKADKENVPAQKRQKHEEPWASACEQKEKGDTHKWGYATKAHFGKTPLKDEAALDPLLQEIGARHGRTHRKHLCEYVMARIGYSLASRAKRRRDHGNKGGHDLRNRGVRG